MKNILILMLVSLSVSLFAQEKELRTFYEDGTVKSLYMYSDADNYKVTNFYQNGKVKEIGQFAKGKMNGEWISFNDAGVKSGEASYVNGQKAGEWKIYDTAGNMRFTINYENGKMLSATNYDPSGKQVAETHSR
ncbi:MAG: hypothetical protein WED33_08405 [Bacteroidia bacterium]